MTNIANVNYDLYEQYLAEVEPLMQQVHAKCIEIGIPFYFVACHKNDENSFVVAQAMHLKKETTPVPLFAAELCGDNRASKMGLGILFATQKQDDDADE